MPSIPIHDWDVKLAAAKAQGLHTAQVARLYGVTDRCVQNNCRKYGITLPDGRALGGNRRENRLAARNGGSRHAGS